MKKVEEQAGCIIDIFTLQRTIGCATLLLRRKRLTSKLAALMIFPNYFEPLNVTLKAQMEKITCMIVL